MTRTTTPTALTLAGLLLGAALLPACQSVNTSRRAEPIGRPDVVQDTQDLRDGGLGNKAAILQVRQAEMPNGLLKIEADLQNLTRRTRRIDYRFEWFDLNGMRVRSAQPGWLNTRIGAGEVVTVSAVAPTRRAVDYELKLVEANTVVKPR